MILNRIKNKFTNFKHSTCIPEEEYKLIFDFVLKKKKLEDWQGPTRHISKLKHFSIKNNTLMLHQRRKIRRTNNYREKLVEVARESDKVC